MKYLRLIIVVLIWFFSLIVSLFAQEIDLFQIPVEKERVCYLDKADGPQLIISFSMFCKPCRKELEGFAKSYDNLKQKFDLEMIAVTSDNYKKYGKRLNKFSKRSRFPFLVFVDNKAEMANFLFSLEGIEQKHFKKNEEQLYIYNPQCFLLDKDGILIKQFRGYTTPNEISTVLEELKK